MFGEMTLIINQDTMREALQEYLNKRITDVLEPGPQVTNVKYNTNNDYFSITLIGKDKR